MYGNTNKLLLDVDNKSRFHSEEKSIIFGKKFVQRVSPEKKNCSQVVSKKKKIVQPENSPPPPPSLF